ncbi:hypothetical protein QVD17_33760 [Tagetes erecta]|uniref:Uncharacterized protein n=1 Tax=Tagetes erecta TaxID=13708 RepID=A0AAD8JZU2_TARER|nr:hypothetical protein QVD17_33760 [Tagetes erecta]
MSLDHMEVTENTSIESVQKSDKVSTLMESKNSDAGVNLCPETPCLTKENVKSTSPSTPIDDVLDACGSGSNHLKHPGTSVSKKLEFGPNGMNDSVSENVFENGSLMETVYESVLEAIICNQAEDILAEIMATGSSCDASRDVVMTPPSVARLTGLAEICPGAPVKAKKQIGRLKDVNMSLCRKLDFDSYA